MPQPQPQTSLTRIDRLIDGVGPLCALLALTLATALGIQSLAPPPVVPVTAPLDVYSGARAFQRLTDLLNDETPHPVGSAANAAVRGRLLAQLRELGLEPELQNALGCAARRPRCAFVTNVVAELPGTGEDVLVLMAHHDSVPHAPGAADDGSGVVTLLETVATLRSDEPRRNDLLLVFTDAEEVGLLGAEAFFAQHARAADVKAVINVEGSGSAGPALLLRTTADGGQLLDAVRTGARFPVAQSYAQEVFSRLPNDTDFTVPERAGIAAIDFAFAFEFGHYHTPLDDLAHLDLGTLQHHGENVLPLVRQLVNADLDERSPRPAFMTLGQRWWLVWPPGASLPIAAVAWLILAIAVWRSGVRPLGLVGGTAFGLAVLVLAVALAWLTLQGTRWVRGGLVSFPASFGPWVLALAAGAVVPTVFLKPLARCLEPASLRLGGWIVLGVLATTLAALAPLAANLLLVPWLAACVLVALTPRVARTRVARPWAVIGADTLALFLLAYLMIAIAWAMLQTQGLRLGIAFAVPLAIAALALPPLLPRLFQRRLFLAPLALVAGWLWIALAPLYSPERPQHLSVRYVANLDRGQAHYAFVTPGAVPERMINALAQTVDEPLARTAVFPWSPDYEPVSVAAPMAPWTPPDIRLTPGATADEQASADSSAQRVTVDVASRTGGYQLAVVVPEGATLATASINGQVLAGLDSSRPLPLTVYGADERSVRFELEFTDPLPTHLIVVDAGWDLPPQATALAETRGALAVPQHQGDMRYGYLRLSLAAAR